MPTSRSRRRSETAAALLALPAAVALAAADGADGLAAARRAATAPDRLPAEREAAVERLLALRRARIEADPGDPRRGLLLADQATDFLYLLLPIRASGVTTLFGLPAEDQRVRARRVARRVHELASEAELELARPAEPDAGGDMARARELRVPLLGGVGACLHAELNVDDPAGRRALRRHAADVLPPLAERLGGRPAVSALLYGGLARLRLGEHAAAATLLERAAAAPAAAPSDTAAALLGAVQVVAARDGPAAALRALDAVERRGDDFFLRLLVADARYAQRRRLAEAASGPRRARLLAGAFGAWIDLLDADDIAAPAGARRAAVLAKLADATGPAAPLDRLPPLVTVARARRLAAGPATRAEAVELLRSVLGRDDLATVGRAEALFALGEAHLAAGRPAAAARRLAALARDQPGDVRAAAAIELAAAAADRAWREDRRDADRRALLRSTLDLLLGRRPALRGADRWRCRAAALALSDARYEAALAHYRAVPRSAASWARAQLGRARAAAGLARSAADPRQRRAGFRLLLDVAAEAREALPGPGGDRSALDALVGEAWLGLGEPQRALEALRSAAPSAEVLLVRSDAWAALGRPDDAQRALERLPEVAGGEAAPLLARAIRRRRPAVEAVLRREGPQAARAEAERRLLPAAGTLRRWLAADGAARPALLLAAADGCRLAGRFAEALPLYERLAQRHPDAIEVLLGRAECLFALGGDRVEEAMGLFRRVATATAARRDGRYWQAQLRMLQILSRSGRNTDRIAPHVAQLRRQDPQLGGEHYRRAFEALARRH